MSAVRAVRRRMRRLGAVARVHDKPPNLGDSYYKFTKSKATAAQALLGAVPWLSYMDYRKELK